MDLDFVLAVYSSILEINTSSFKHMNLWKVSLLFESCTCSLNFGHDSLFDTFAYFRGKSIALTYH